MKNIRKELFLIVHYTYGDVCGDDYYGKEGKVITADIVRSTEEQVRKAVSLLNKLNNSYYASEPKDEWDSDFMDEDYYYYKRVNPGTPMDVIKVRSYKYGRGNRLCGKEPLKTNSANRIE